MGAEIIAGRAVAPTFGFGVRLATGTVFGLVLIGLFIGPAILLMVACVVAGFGITYLSGIRFQFEERLAFGTVIGAMAVAVVAFGLSSLVKDVTLLTAGVGMAVAVAVGVATAIVHRSEVQADWTDAGQRWSASPRSAGHPWPVAAVFLVCATWTVHLLHQAYVIKPDDPAHPGAGGLYTGYVNIWGDWAAHLTFAGSFAYAHNFPPEYPIDPGNRMGYPFMVDFLSANLVPLGSSLTTALVLITGLLGLAFPVVLYLAAARFTGGRAAATIAVFVFLLSGGLGFFYFAADIDKNGLLAVQHLVREYTLQRDLNYMWLNPVLAYLIPQRSTLFGFSLVLVVLLVLWIAIREGSSWRPFLFAGVIAGAMPAFHVHAFGTAVALALFWAVATNRRREWLYFFVPAIVLAVPVLLWMWPPVNNSVCGDRFSFGGYCIEPGWLSYTDWKRDAPRFGIVVALPVDFVWFWLKNLGAFVPLLLVAQALPRAMPTDFGKWFAPMWLWFLVPCIVVLQPWDWDNTKFFVFWALLGSIMVGGLLAHMFKRTETAVLAALLLFLLGFAGTLDLVRASDFQQSSNEFTDTKGIQVADWVRQHTSPSAIFAVGDDHNSPIPTLAGRRVMIGYSGWLWTYGLGDYQNKQSDELAILRGDPATPELVQRYHVSYVLMGPQELGGTRRANLAYWQQNGTQVYSNGEFSVFRTSYTGT